MPQVRTEELLEQHAVASGVQVLRGLEVTGITATDAGARVTVAGLPQPREFTGAFLVGCDGRRSIVREASGIGYTGEPRTRSPAPSATSAVDDPDVPPPPVTMHSAGRLRSTVRIDAGRSTG